MKSLALAHTLAIGAVVGLSVSAPAFAHPAGHGDYTPKTPAPAPPATAIPETYPQVVTALSDQLKASNTALDTLKIADLTASCVTIKALAAALPAKAATLLPDDKAMVEATAIHLEKNVADVVGSAKKGDMEAAKSAMATVGADIDVLRGLVK